jgi:glycosyltransferase involved in cell wall biosynthesis
MRILYLQTSPVPPPVDSGIDRFVLLSGRLEGEVLQPIWCREAEQVEKVFGPGSWPRYRRGKFQYRWLLSWRWTGLSRFLHTNWFYISEGLRAHREKPIDCVMTYSHMTTALCGIVIKVLTGARLVVEVSSSPDRLYLHDTKRIRLRDLARRCYSDICLHISMWACDCVHLLYAEALDPYPLLRGTRKAVFHEFVPVSVVPRHECAGDPYILLLGAPWYLKGADILVDAFRRLAPDFPGVRLKIMGHFPDRSLLEAVIDGAERIEILPSKHYKETLGILSRASILVLPSRCEGMGRVLLEAMAAGIPVVGSDIGGIPTLIRHGENGFLFPVGDVSALEARLRQLLSDRELRERMGKRGYESAHTDFDEQVYVDRFVQMIEIATGAD